ncbi:MAG: DUF2829 domain-containing protein [Anaerolineaceae bacterium]|nr:DUF2829 domain-containing protein [Anaerolineaceae bacterium]
MNFGEAIQEMKKGKRVRRKEWANDTWITVDYIASCPPFISAYISLGRDNSFDGHKTWIPSPEDLLAEDWEIKDEPQKANNGMNGLLYLSLLMFIFALENLPKEPDTDCH